MKKLTFILLFLVSFICSAQQQDTTEQNYIVFNNDTAWITGPLFSYADTLLFITPEFSIIFFESTISFGVLMYLWMEYKENKLFPSYNGFMKWIINEFLFKEYEGKTKYNRGKDFLRIQYK